MEALDNNFGKLREEIRAAEEEKLKYLIISSTTTFMRQSQMRRLISQPKYLRLENYPSIKPKNQLSMSSEPVSYVLEIRIQRKVLNNTSQTIRQRLLENFNLTLNEVNPDNQAADLEAARSHACTKTADHGIPFCIF